MEWVASALSTTAQGPHSALTLIRRRKEEEDGAFSNRYH